MVIRSPMLLASGVAKLSGLKPYRCDHTIRQVSTKVITLRILKLEYFENLPTFIDKKSELYKKKCFKTSLQIVEKAQLIGIANTAAEAIYM